MPQEPHELKVEHQRVGGTNLLTPNEALALELAIDVPTGRTKLDTIQERRYLFAHMAEATNPDGDIAKPHVRALHGAEVTIHGHTYQAERFLGRGFTGVALEARRQDTAETAAIKLSKPYDHRLLNATTFASKAEEHDIQMARAMMNEIASLHTLTRDAHGQPLRRQGGNPPFPILVEAQLLHDPAAPKGGADMRIAAAVLEWIEGQNLQKIVRQEGHLRDQVDRLKKVSLGLVRAIRRIHEAGVLHLDLKSANVMLTPADDPIVLDFGSSQQPRKWAGTSTGKPIVWSQPPAERIATRRYTTRQDKAGQPRPANDVYSLGITLQDLVYGVDDTIDRAGIRAELSPELRVLDEVITKMTHADPDQRPNLRDIEMELTNGWQVLQDSAATAAVRQQIAS